jgi:chemotaxis protein methyltransferase CheR
VTRAPIRLEPASSEFFEVLCERWGLSRIRYRDSILARREGACLRALRARSPREGARVVGVDPAAAERALGAVMIGVTGFFRDRDVWKGLRDLAPRMRRPFQPLRALSVGCSDGSELYSLAMLLAEGGLLDDARLHGLDCRPAAVRSARAGVYPEEALTSVPPRLRARHFAPVAGPGQLGVPGSRSGTASPCAQVADPLRAACRWSVADAFGPAPGPWREDDFDLIFCRNLAIYLTFESASELWSTCLERLRPGGLLVTGKAERPPAEIRRSLRRIGRCIYRRN